MPNRNTQKPALTDEQIEELLELLEHDKRVRWLWSTARTLAVWIAAVFGGVTVGWDTLAKIVKTLGKG
jgi:hypothetical protein